jgi:hypothetical protein
MTQFPIGIGIISSERLRTPFVRTFPPREIKVKTFSVGEAGYGLLAKETTDITFSANS